MVSERKREREGGILGEESREYEGGGKSDIERKTDCNTTWLL